MTGGQMEAIKVELFGTDVRVTQALEQARNLSVSKASVLIVGENEIGRASCRERV